MTRASDLNARLQQALASHRSGRLAEARAAYESVLAAVPNNPDVLHLLGTLLTQLGKPGEALPLLERAVRHAPRSSPFQSHLADALLALGRGDEAEAAWRAAVRIDSKNAEACFALAGFLVQAGRWSDAEPFARQAATLLPSVAAAQFRFGSVLERLGRAGEAVGPLRIAARAVPGERDAHRRLVTAALAAGEAAVAWRAVQRATVLAPEAPDNFVAVEAVAPAGDAGIRKRDWARRGVTAAPLSAYLNAVVAGYRIERHDYRGAIAAARRSAVLGPEAVHGYTAWARAANALPGFEEAGRATRWGLCLSPGDAELTYQMAQVEKAVGDLARGWALDEHRVRSIRFHRTAELPERWAGPGSPLGRLLVATEQGIGDEILFMSCLPDLLNDVAGPVVELDERFHPLFRRSYPDVTFVPRQAHRWEAGRVVFDYARVRRDHAVTHYIHAGSLPGLYRGDRAHPATRRGYLQASPPAVAQWRDRLAALGPEPKVGVCWRSVIQSSVRASHYAPLAVWETLLTAPGVRFVSLQYDDCRAEIEALKSRTGTDLHQPEGLDQTNDLDGTAALISALDAVVSAPTSVCMSAAALGIETFRIGQSTYSIGREHDHFFPSMHPMSPWGRPLDLGLALTRAREALLRFLAR